jgi:hypothetical protein
VVRLLDRYVSTRVGRVHPETNLGHIRRTIKLAFGSTQSGRCGHRMDFLPRWAGPDPEFSGDARKSVNLTGVRARRIDHDGRLNLVSRAQPYALDPPILLDDRHRLFAELNFGPNVALKVAAPGFPGS